jgi:hypothetical protein
LFRNRETVRGVGTVALVVLLVVSVSAGGVAVSAATAAGTVSGDKTTATADIDESLRERSGTVQAVVRFPAADTTSMSPAARTERLRRHAERSQSSFRAFAADTPSVDIERSFWLTNAMLVSVDTETTPLETLADVEGVTRIHENYGGELQATAAETTASNDNEPRPRQSAEGPSVASGIDQISAQTAWQFHGTRGEGSAVAILDTGVDPEGHAGIADSLSRGGWAEFDPRTGERVESDPYDPKGHGTRLSGIVAGGQTDEGVAYGVAPETALYHGKVVGERGFSFASVTAGMEWAVENDVDAVSLSLGPVRYAGAFVEPVENARSAGVVVVGSIGNTGRYTSVGPGNLLTAVGVGSVDAEGSVPEWSGGEEIDTQRYWGKNAPSQWGDEYTVPEVTAPGVGVTVSQPGGGYGTGEGSSYATPHVAGVAALAASATDAGMAKIESAIVGTALHPDAREPFSVDPGRDDRHGSGVVNAVATLSRLRAEETLSGTVTTADGEPLEGVLVASEAGPRTRTDADGRYTLELSPGEQPVVALGVGFEPAVEPLDPATTDGQSFELTSGDVGARTLEPLRDRVGPGQQAVTTLEVGAAESVSVDADTQGLVQQDALTLRINGETASFGETVDLGSSERPRRLTIEIGTEEGTPPGSVEPTVRLEGGGESLSGSLGRLYVHSDPLRIGSDVPVDIQEPVDVLAPGTTIVLEDGTYEASEAGPASLVLDRPISLVAAEGANPTLVASSDAESGILVTANDVEIRGLEIDGNGSETTVQVGTQGTGRETVAPSGVTVAENRLLGGTDGLVTWGGPALLVERNRVAAQRDGIRVSDPQRSTVRDNVIEGANTGIRIEGSATDVTGNRISGAKTGIHIEVPLGKLEALAVEFGPIAGNEIGDSAEGLRIVGGVPEGSVGDNTFRNVTTNRVTTGNGSDGGPTGPGGTGDSALGVALYAATGVSVASLFVPYGIRRLRRR